MDELIKAYTPTEIAQVLHCTERTVLTYLREGKIPARKIGRRWIVLEEDLREYLRIKSDK